MQQQQRQKESLDKSRRELAHTKKELDVYKRTLGCMVTSPRTSLTPTPNHGGGNNNVGSFGQGQQPTFAAVFATALETALSAAGLRLTSSA